MGRAPWWKGRRGEWYAIAQWPLFALVLLGPRVPAGAHPWPVEVVAGATLAGGALTLVGGLMLIVGIGYLGARNLSILPYPTEGATLVEDGPYGLVRHPIYSGIVIGSVGLALLWQGLLTLLWAAVLFAFFDAKSRFEERSLLARFPEYASYRQHVRKLVPFVY